MFLQFNVLLPRRNMDYLYCIIKIHRQHHQQTLAYCIMLFESQFSENHFTFRTEAHICNQVRKSYTNLSPNAPNSKVLTYAAFHYDDSGKSVHFRSIVFRQKKTSSYIFVRMLRLFLRCILGHINSRRKIVEESLQKCISI